MNTPDGLHVVSVVTREGMTFSMHFTVLEEAKNYYELYSEPDTMYRQISSITFEDAKAGEELEVIMNECKSVAE